MMRARTLVIVGLFTIGVGLSVPRSLLAQGGIPACETLTNPVFMAGTTAVIPVIRLMGARLKQAGVTLLWNENDDGCHAVNLLISPPTNNQKTVFSQYDEAPGQSGKVIVSGCNSLPNKVPDLVINDVSWTSCLLSYGSTGVATPLPSGLKEFQGPVQGLVPIVASSYTYYNDITVPELQDLYVCGGNANILTFTNSASIFDYNYISSGMRELWARGLGFVNGSALTTQIGLGANSNITAETMVTSYIAPATNPEQAFGYTSTEFYDAYRDRVRGLKVRGLNQNLAYWPDSDMTTTDKINIREGRYTLQGALRLIAAVDANGVPTNLGAQHLIDWFQQNTVSDPALQLPFDVTEIYALRGVVPQCAMKVKRDGDAALFKHYKHPQPCHCSFEFLATGKTGCVPCAGVDAGTCQPGQSCSHGYCEQVQ
jgi:hypothetical protein